MVSAPEMFFALVIGHAVADYPLQADFLARGKNHRAALPGVPWVICLSMHALVHAGAVWAITGSAALGLTEFAAHVVIDYGKCDGWYGDGERAFWTDQALHVLTKAVLLAAVSR